MHHLMPYVNRWDEPHLELKDCYFEPMDMNVNFIRRIIKNMHYGMRSFSIVPLYFYFSFFHFFAYSSNAL